MVGFVDFWTLWIILFAAFDLGIIGFFDFDTMAWAFGSHEKGALLVVGLSACWQLCRQKLWG
jgi:uncharacterized membrane protein YuzA (DUF378 family)